MGAGIGKRESIGLGVGLGLLVLSGFLPAFPWDLGTPGLPPSLQPGPKRAVLIGAGAEVHAAWGDLASGVHGAVTGQGMPALWRNRVFYPHALVPLWGLLLLLATRRGTRWMGGLLSLGVLVLEGAYLRSDYVGLLPRLLGSLEVGLVFGGIALLLLGLPWRWRHRAVYALVGSQAALAVLHALTLPPTWARTDVQSLGWMGALGPILGRFGPGYWVALAGFALVAGFALRAAARPGPDPACPRPR